VQLLLPINYPLQGGLSPRLSHFITPFQSFYHTILVILSPYFSQFITPFQSFHHPISVILSHYFSHFITSFWSFYHPMSVSSSPRFGNFITIFQWVDHPASVILSPYFSQFITPFQSFYHPISVSFFHPISVGLSSVPFNRVNLFSKIHSKFNSFINLAFHFRAARIPQRYSLQGRLWFATSPRNCGWFGNVWFKVHQAHFTKKHQWVSHAAN